MWESNAGVFNFYLRITTTNKVKELKKIVSSPSQCNMSTNCVSI